MLPSANICRVARCQIGPIGYQTGFRIWDWQVHWNTFVSMNGSCFPCSSTTTLRGEQNPETLNKLCRCNSTFAKTTYTLYYVYGIRGLTDIRWATQLCYQFPSYICHHQSTPLEDMKQKSRNNLAFSHPKSSDQILVVRKISSLGTWEQGVYPWQFHYSTYRGHVNNGTWPMCKNTVSTNKKSRNHGAFQVLLSA